MLALFCFKPWRINFQVFFTTSYLLSMVLGFVWPIVFDVPKAMHLASYSKVFLFPIVLILRDFRVHVSTIYSGNKLSNVETTVNNWLSFGTTLQVPDINLYYNKVGFGWSLDNMRMISLINMFLLWLIQI